MRTSVRTVMNARAKQRKTSLVVQGFKCQEIEYKRYLKSKRYLRYVDDLIKKLENNETTNDAILDTWYIKKKEITEEILKYEKKHNINEKPKKPVREKEYGLMSKVRSLFRGGKR